MGDMVRVTDIERKPLPLWRWRVVVETPEGEETITLKNYHPGPIRALTVALTDYPVEKWRSIRKVTVRKIQERKKRQRK